MVLQSGISVERDSDDGNRRSGENGRQRCYGLSLIHIWKLQPDDGKIEWAKNVRVGYLDQHTVLEKGMTIRDVLKSAYSHLFEMEERMNVICDSMGEVSEKELEQMMEELGIIQELLTVHDFYAIDALSLIHI